MRFWLSCALILFLSLSVSAAGSFEFNPECQKAYKLIWSYKLSEADKLLEKEKEQNDDNLIPLYLQSFRDFMYIFTTEDKEAYKKYIASRGQHIDQLGKGDDASPWREYSRSEIYLQSAMLKIKFNDYLAGAYDIQRAYNSLNGLLKRHPDFLPAKKDFLILTAAVGTVPDNYQWILRILGFNGNLTKSMTEYAQLLKDMQASPDYKVFLNESQIYYGYMSYYLGNNPNQAWQHVQLATGDYAANPVSAFVRASMAMRLKENGQVIEILTPHVRQTPAFPHLDYLMGNAQLFKVSKEAGLYFARYLKTFKGQSYIKDTYLKLGWAFLLNGDKENYEKCIRLMQHYGSTVLEEDKHALNEAQTPINRHAIELLKARLYYDGGYYREAYATLKAYNNRWTVDLTKEQQTEFWYRHGRIADAINETQEAEKCYFKVYYEYSDVKNYFPPAACFYLASIYEKQGKTKEAKDFYTRTLFYRGYVYKDAFDQKAYAGLKRLEKQ